MATDGAAETDTRLTNLEIKLGFTEDLVERLNDTVARQGQQIDRLLREIARLGEQFAQAAPATTRSLRDDLPPHY